MNREFILENSNNHDTEDKQKVSPETQGDNFMKENSVVSKSNNGDVEKDERYKGAMYMVLYGLVISVSLLFA